MNGKCTPQSPSFPTPTAPTPSAPSPSGRGACGCSTCTSLVLNRNADGHKVSARIDWLEANRGMSEMEACKTVCATEFPDICGECNPDSCDGEGPESTPAPTSSSTLTTVSPSTMPSELTSVCNNIIPSEYTLPAMFRNTNYCYKIQVRNGGRLFVDRTDPGCVKFDAGNSFNPMTVSRYRRTNPGGIAIYKGRWSGTIELLQDPSLNKAKFELSGNRRTRTFSGILTVPSCSNEA